VGKERYLVFSLVYVDMNVFTINHKSQHIFDDHCVTYWIVNHKRIGGMSVLVVFWE